MSLQTSWSSVAHSYVETNVISASLNDWIVLSEFKTTRAYYQQMTTTVGASGILRYLLFLQSTYATRYKFNSGEIKKKAVVYSILRFNHRGLIGSYTGDSSTQLMYTTRTFKRRWKNRNTFFIWFLRWEIFVKTVETSFLFSNTFKALWWSWFRTCWWTNVNIV